MPLCGAVTKLTRLSPNTDDCTLWTPAAIIPTVSARLGGGIDWGRKESRKIFGRGRLAPIHADAVLVGERWRRGREQRGRRGRKGCEGERGPGEVEGSSEESGKGWKFAQAWSATCTLCIPTAGGWLIGYMCVVLMYIFPNIERASWCSYGEIFSVIMRTRHSRDKWCLPGRGQDLPERGDEGPID